MAAGCGGGLEQRPAHGLGAGHARSGRLHDGDHEPVLADGSRRPLGLPRDGRRGRRTEGRGDRHRHGEDGHGHRGTGRPRRRLGGRAAGRGHVRLVRAGRRREHLVPRRGHEGVREREAEDDRRLVGGGRRRCTGRHRRAGESRARARVPAGVLRRGGRGRRHSALTRRVGGGAGGLLPRRADDEGLHAARARRSSSTSSTRRASGRCSCSAISGGSDREELLSRN